MSGTTVEICSLPLRFLGVGCSNLLEHPMHALKMLGKFEGRASVTNCREDKRLYCPTAKEIRGEFSFYVQDLVKQESSK